MNKYVIYLSEGLIAHIEGAKYEIDYQKGLLTILNDKGWKIGMFFLKDVAGFIVEFEVTDGKESGNE